MLHPDWLVQSDGRESRPYAWDDTRASLDFAYDASEWPELLRNASVRARMALCTGLYEQVLWRLHSDADVPAARTFAQAAWCATLDPRYLSRFDWMRRDWQGPILGPLWCGATWLHAALTQGDYRDSEIDDALIYLARLACHVSTDPDALITWMQTTGTYLVEAYPRLPQDSWTDLFNHYPGRHRGALVPRTALGRPGRVPTAGAWSELRQLLELAVTQRNPHLPNAHALAAIGLHPDAHDLDFAVGASELSQVTSAGSRSERGEPG